MTSSSVLSSDYWTTFQITQSDLEFLYNHLLEIEIPQTSKELIKAIISNRIEQLKAEIVKKRSAEGEIYKPESDLNIGQNIIFPEYDWKSAKVINKRPGVNPDVNEFYVIEVEFEDKSKRQFASNLQNHQLNASLDENITDPNLIPDDVYSQYKNILISQLNKSLEQNQDLVQIAGRWFPESLLIDINVGYLNLAEALLDMEAGGPISVDKILEQIELPTDTNQKLSEFSMNYALQEDERFDEVGPAGKILWFLKRLEPKNVLETPLHLKYQPNESKYNYEEIAQYIEILDSQICDELDPIVFEEEIDNTTISLIYPHWRNGTLPLSDRVKNFFPTAYEAPRVQFTFIDVDDNTRYSGWIVRTSNYVYGLKEWYEKTDLLPGSLINIRCSANPGEVIIKAPKRRSTREWIRTALVGTDNEIVFATLKQMVSADFNERMIIAVPDVDAIDKLWESQRKSPIDKIVKKMVRELAKLNPQGHVHALEIYSAVNLIKRCPPGPILDILFNSEWSNHFGDLYFHVKES